MATIITKNSGTASSVPTGAQLTAGELAVNTADKRLFTKNGGGTVVELGTNPSSLTLPNGTANGVPYLNASKVLTSGSALTFDGSTFATTGNMSVPISKSYYCYTSDYGVGTPDSLGLQLFYAAGDVMRFGSRSAGTFSEQMRLTSTGLGIGTSSPSRKLTVASETAGLPTLGTGSGGLFLSSNNGLYGLFGGVNGSTGDTWLQAMRNDSALAYNIVLNPVGGNLGLGVTPSAWWSGLKALQINSVGAISASTGAVDLSNNYYYNGTNNVYLTTGYASLYSQTSGQHIWKTAPSGTAGAAITFTQAMTLDASGNLLVGTTSSAGRLTVNTGSSFAVAAQLGNSSGNKVVVLNDDGGGYVKLDASGSGGSSIALRFDTGGAERARIDSSGNLLVGTTSGSFGQTGFILNPSYNAAGSAGIAIQHPNGSASGHAYAGFIYNGTGIGSITQNGTTGVLYNLTSDYRLKNNPVPVTGAKEFINALQPKTWDWWDGSGKGVGFIAHEFMEVAKYSGNGTKDAVDDDGNPVYQSIQPSSSEVMANLVAYVQELRAEFDAYKAAHP